MRIHALDATSGALLWQTGSLADDDLGPGSGAGDAPTEPPAAHVQASLAAYLYSAHAPAAVAAADGFRPSRTLRAFGGHVWQAGLPPAVGVAPLLPPAPKTEAATAAAAAAATTTAATTESDVADAMSAWGFLPGYHEHHEYRPRVAANDGATAGAAAAAAAAAAMVVVHSAAGLRAFALATGAPMGIVPAASHALHVALHPPPRAAAANGAGAGAGASGEGGSSGWGAQLRALVEVAQEDRLSGAALRPLAQDGDGGQQQQQQLAEDELPPGACAFVAHGTLPPRAERFRMLACGSAAATKQRVAKAARAAKRQRQDEEPAAAAAEATAAAQRKLRHREEARLAAFAPWSIVALARHLRTSWSDAAAAFPLQGAAAPVSLESVVLGDPVAAKAAEAVALGEAAVATAARGRGGGKGAAAARGGRGSRSKTRANMLSGFGPDGARVWRASGAPATPGAYGSDAAAAASAAGLQLVRLPRDAEWWPVGLARHCARRLGLLGCGNAGDDDAGGSSGGGGGGWLEKQHPAATGLLSHGQDALMLHSALGDRVALASLPEAPVRPPVLGPHAVAQQQRGAVTIVVVTASATPDSAHTARCFVLSRGDAVVLAPQGGGLFLLLAMLLAAAAHCAGDAGALAEEWDDDLKDAGARKKVDAAASSQPQHGASERAALSGRAFTSIRKRTRR